MLLRIVLLLTLVPAAELFVMLSVHRVMAARWGAEVALLVTLGAIVLSGLIGASLARRQGLRAIRSLQEALARGEFPGPPLIDAALILAGGALLVLPGYLTDILGITLLIPWSRAVYRRAFLAWLRRKIGRGEATFSARNFGVGPRMFDQGRDDIVIDVTPEDEPRTP